MTVSNNYDYAYGPSGATSTIYRSQSSFAFPFRGSTTVLPYREPPRRSSRSLRRDPWRFEFETEERRKLRLAVERSVAAWAEQVSALRRHPAALGSLLGFLPAFRRRAARPFRTAALSSSWRARAPP